MIARLEGWEARLAYELKATAARPFHPRRWNCVEFAAVCVEAMTGQTIPRRWKGSVEATADAVLPRVEPRQARRGDVVLAHIPEPSLGVCLGRVAAFVGVSGIHTIPMSQVTAAWSV